MYFLKLLLVVQFVFFYQEGGQGFSWMKKWLASSVLAGLLLLTLFLGHKLGWLSAAGSLLYIAAANGFAYGDKFTHGKTWLKFLFRGLCGASYGVCGLLIGIGTHHWALGLAQLILATAGSILLGVLNPFPNKWGNWATRAEDICISLCYVSLLFLMV